MEDSDFDNNDLLFTFKEKESFNDSDDSWHPESENSGDESIADSDEDRVSLKKTKTSNLRIGDKIVLNPCWLCEKIFECEWQLDNHLSLEHEIEIERSERFQNPLGQSSFKKGQKKNNESKHEKCEFCDQIFFKKGDLRKHEESHSEDKLNVCSDCGIRFEHSEDLKQHAAKENNNNCRNESFICCGEVFTRRMDFISHKKTNHDRVEHFTKLFACTRCLIDFKFISHLRKHQKTCGLEKNVSCPSVVPTCGICQETFNSRSSLYLHICENHQEQPSFPCKHCPKTLASIEQLKLHQQKHKIIKSYSCSFCQKKFRDYHIYVRHRKSHIKQEQQNNICSFCSKVLCSAMALQVHIKIHTGERQYVCQYCSKSFIQKQSLEAHLRSHTKERDFLCKFCGKTFVHYSSMKCHERVHTGHKPYNCQHCQKTFTRYGTYQNHVRVHTGEKPFECTQCGKRFTQRSTLNSHFKTHEKHQIATSNASQNEPKKNVRKKTIVKAIPVSVSVTSPLVAFSQETKQEITPHLIRQENLVNENTNNKEDVLHQLIDEGQPNQEKEQLYQELNVGSEQSIKLKQGVNQENQCISNFLEHANISMEGNVLTKIVVTGNLDSNALSRVLFSNGILDEESDINQQIYVYKGFDLHSFNNQLVSMNKPIALGEINVPIQSDSSVSVSEFIPANTIPDEATFESQECCDSNSAFYSQIKSLEGH